MTIKIDVSDSLLNIKFQKAADIGDHVATLKSEIIRLASMAFEIKEQMKVAILITLLSYITEFTAMNALVSTFKYYYVIWNHSILFLK